MKFCSFSIIAFCSHAAGKRQARIYHVEFFGDKSYHSWLSGNVLFPFLGSVELLMQDPRFLKHVKQHC